MKMRYVELDPTRVFNLLAPENITCFRSFPKWWDTWWEPETLDKRKLFGNMWMKEFDKLTNHFTSLKESISQDGIRCPISVVSGIQTNNYFFNKLDMRIFPEHEITKGRHLLHSRVFGGSRLGIALQLGITSVPCVVYDYSNQFSDAPEITKQNYQNWFRDEYVFINSVPYLRAKSMTGSTRQNQTLASKNAKAKLNV